MRSTVINKNSSHCTLNATSDPMAKLHNMMMVTFTRLFMMRIVANVRSESSRNIWILRSLSFFSGSSSSRSCGERLKKAISEPLAKPDKKSKKAANTAATTMAGVNGLNTSQSLNWNNRIVSKISSR